MLFVVSTPIGNLKDISPRAIQTLKDVHLILAEDTRHTRQLCSHFDIHTPIQSYHAHSKLERVEQIVEKLREHDLALVSDAGTPGISDPGSLLIAKAVEAGIEVSPIPGASAVLASIICTGFDLSRFVFLGFLPQKKSHQIRLIEEHLPRKCPLILYESPYRVVSMLTTLEPVLNKREIVIGRELTKKFEEFVRGTASELLIHFKKKPPKGEFVVVINA
ncbi:16S rRNA (cytidine(1402)-2'-O)-methyltransferase [Candidatus Wirthbacteria bacterium CG2_30_54_11]|uniref:Ribosomal RNA small subunit methyltransferase I n=1 Tax=Candidatus Wirthbacteria bacterium CG2_30_54_11 TaxID=1817892 RepID=A0A1J5IMY7_9BACT|nr:MAG: 16S rRNA (cytidine(1402)-2'-O)-methyltransferase [Candidatus Wirthbacteria bacterium CG2_30_54_11]